MIYDQCWQSYGYERVYRSPSQHHFLTTVQYYQPPSFVLYHFFSTFLIMPAKMLSDVEKASIFTLIRENVSLRETLRHVFVVWDETLPPSNVSRLRPESHRTALSHPGSMGLGTPEKLLRKLMQF
ncbi:hypothetical protein Pcinc_004132 [Petrolisthes cinctipes]|uniref:Uncharacterized protein n=1 Tax=Petrolisthes cinctipes TaxID=88211 RepID=A0AAE1GHQ4_PETCI|nr:hypothetical protein Pcinc_004132 [Petrolisthes cinctipes]